jgi:putative phosphoesterase
MRAIGAISDTHGLLRPQAVAALAGCDPIIHVGNVGSPDVLARLGALAPVHAVRGNVDHNAWSTNLPVTQRIEIDGFRIYVLHILAELDPQAADNVDAVIYGICTSPRSRQRTAHSFQSGQCRTAPLPPTHHGRPHDRGAWQFARRNR